MDEDNIDQPEVTFEEEADDIDDRSVEDFEEEEDEISEDLDEVEVEDDDEEYEDEALTKDDTLDFDGLSVAELRKMYRALNEKQRVFFNKRGLDYGTKSKRPLLLERLEVLTRGATVELKGDEPVVKPRRDAVVKEPSPELDGALDIISKSLVSAQFATVAITANVVNRISETKGSNIRVKPEKVYAENTDALVKATKVVIEEHYGPDTIGELSPLATLALIHFGLITQSIKYDEPQKKEDLIGHE